MGIHNRLRAGLIIATFIVYLASGAINFLASSDTIPTLFPNSTGELSDLYTTEITPADLTFMVIWIVIYAYQFLFMMYALSTLLRSSGPGYLYTTPNYLPPAVYITFIVTHVTTTTWSILWANQQIEACLVFVVLAVFSAYISLGAAGHGVFTNQKALISYGHSKEYRWVYALVINPLGLYAMWLTMALLINLAIVLIYSVGVSQMAAGSISLALLMILVIMYSLVDLAFYERYFRYLYTPFITLIWAFIGILISDDADFNTSNTVLTLGLAVVCSVIFIIKIFLSLMRAMRKPLFLKISDNGSPMLPQPVPTAPMHFAAVASPPPPTQPLPSWGNLLNP